MAALAGPYSFSPTPSDVMMAALAGPYSFSPTPSIILTGTPVFIGLNRYTIFWIKIIALL